MFQQLIQKSVWVLLLGSIACGGAAPVASTPDPAPDTSPETTIASGPGSQTADTSASFVFDSNTNSTFECRIDSGNFEPCTSPFILEDLEEGTHTFEVRSISAGGTTDPSPASYSWQVGVNTGADTLAPESFISSGPNAQTTSTSATFTFSANETATFECNLNNTGYSACTSPASRTGLAVGSHTFAVRARDTASNLESTPATYNWQVIAVPDTTPPQTTINSGPTSQTTNTSATFTFSANETATFACNFNNGGYSACTSPFTRTGLAVGSYNFAVRATDTANNTDATPATHNWQVIAGADTQAPQTTIVSGPASTTTSTSATFVFSADETATFACNLNNAGYSACTSPATYNNLSVGARTFAVRATDAANNTDATPATHSWTINASFGLTSRASFAGSNFPSGLATPAPLTITDAFTSLSFSNVNGQTFYQPLHLVESPDGSNRMFIVLKDGRVYYFNKNSNGSNPTLFLDLSYNGNPYSSNGVLNFGESGLLGLAFDPNFATNRYYYAHYVAFANGALRSYVSRFRATADLLATEAGSETVLIRVLHQNGAFYHKGGTIVFGPDQMLYIAMGDGGPSPNDAQSLDTLRGKILRIDVRATSSGRNYTIPSDNPYANTVANPSAGVNCSQADQGNQSVIPSPNRCEEIWAYGLRNPWRISFDRDTGLMWVGEVGQYDWEEVNVVTRGGNYGWPRYEGTMQVASTAFDGVTAPHTPPVFQYPHSGNGVSGVSISGGVVYRGSQMPSLYGKYIFTDLISGIMWAFDATGSTVTQNDVTEVVTSGISAAPVAIVEDVQGEIYMVQLALDAPSAATEVYRFAEASGNPTAPAVPATLSATGLFSNLSTLTPVSGLIEYDVNSPLWSDYAMKRRWIAVPNNQRITFASTGSWTFPTGTIFVKHFELQLSSNQTKRLETRVIINDVSGWQGYTYKWNDAQTDADLLPGSVSEVLNVQASAVGGARTQTWNYPSRAQCRMCHTSTVGTVLGVRTHQINRNFAYSAATDNQLRSWNNINLFTTNIGSASQYAALVNITDTSASLTDRVKSYFASNCIQCHNPGPAPVSIDMRFETAVDDMHMVDEIPQATNMGLTNARIVAPGSKESSVLWERLRHRLDAYQMPPLGTNIVDPDAQQVIGDWIDAGAP